MITMLSCLSNMFQLTNFHYEYPNAKFLLATCGSSIVLKCPIGVDNTSVTTWFRLFDNAYPQPLFLGDRQLTDDERFMLRVQSGTSDNIVYRNLEISQLYKGDEGYYICKVAKHIHASFNVTVRTSSCIDIVPSSTYVTIGETFRLTCRVWGVEFIRSIFPVNSFNVQWYRNEHPLNMSTRTTMYSDHDSKTYDILVINNAHRSDTGIYKCRYGGWNTTAHVTVTYNPVKSRRLISQPANSSACITANYLTEILGTTSREMEDNPPDGGTIHRKRKKSTQRDDERRSKSRATNHPQRQQHPQLTKPPAHLVPLILQGVKITRFQLSKLITKNMPDVKLTNIQSNKNNTFTIFASDVNSYDRILRDLAKQKFDNENDVKVYIPRSIQKVLDADKQAFLKRVDVEITTPAIENALTAAGFKYEKLERLQNFKKDGPGTTVKLTFADSFNRGTIVRTGLHLQHLNIIAEPAKYLTKLMCSQTSSKAKYQKVTIEFEKACEVEKENYLQKIRQTNVSKKSWWNLAKTLFRWSRSSKISKLKDQNNQEWSEDKMEAHVCNQHFAAICIMTTADYDKDIPPDKLPLSSPTLDLFTVTTRVVEKCLKINVNKATSQGISSKILKEAGPVIAEDLKHICNYSLSSGVFPDK
ncbi:unnamed protein product [Didymodactylos carnosus]|uniref:Ig-like domain-containing protein n=1 Tax=Didymodactylos carnosus TaxID=1234261 RepID=A0A813S157_9BILA|nr:unnamed protein product [Didymodactylos carnosus]CAF3577655.1 unnamed protein product [Didymodactylos carnosus]